MTPMLSVTSCGIGAKLSLAAGSATASLAPQCRIPSKNAKPSSKRGSVDGTRFLSIPDWSEEELVEMREGLRRYVVYGLKKKAVAMARLRW